MRIIRRVDDPTRGVMVGDAGDVLGYVRDIEQEADGSLIFANDFEAPWAPEQRKTWREEPDGSLLVTAGSKTPLTFAPSEAEALSLYEQATGDEYAIGEKDDGVDIAAGYARVKFDWPTATDHTVVAGTRVSVHDPESWTLDGAKVWEMPFTMQFNRWRDAPVLLRPFVRPPLHVVQLGWALTAWIVWRVIRGR